MIKKEVNMLSGSVIKGLITISLPIMVMNVLQSLFNIIDMTILKTFDSDGGYSVGAVGSSGTLISLITGLLIGIATGSNVVVAKYIGKNDQENVDKAIGTSISFSILGGFFLLIIGTIFAKVFLTWMNCPIDLLDHATLYFRLYFLGVPILMFYNFCASILRSSGNSKGPMLYLTLGGIIKVLLNVVFVAFLKMNVTGVALATILSWLTSALLALRALVKNDGKVKIKLKYLKIYPNLLKEILIIGIPTGLQTALYSIANVIITAKVNAMGPDATTGVSIANTFDGIMYQISVAPSYAVMPYVSQNIGAGNIKRAKEATLKGLLITILLGGFFGALFSIFSKELSSIMSDNPVVISYSQQKMIIISATYFISGINESLGGSLKGMGRPLIPMICTMIYMCAIRFVWIYLIYPLMPTLTFLYLIWPIGWILSVITVLFFYFQTLKRIKKQINYN